MKDKLSTVTGYERYKFLSRLATGVATKSALKENPSVPVNIIHKALHEMTVGEQGDMKERATAVVLDYFDCGLLGMLCSYEGSHIRFWSLGNAHPR